MSQIPGPVCRYLNLNHDYGTLLGCSRSVIPGPVGVKPPRALDELTPIARWMVREMQQNASGEHARRIHELNNFNLETCVSETRNWSWWQQLFLGNSHIQHCAQQGLGAKAAAYMAWAFLVRQNGAWDHKPFIARTFTPAVTSGEQHYHRYHGHVYFYDIWSNIHYGYVGRACGFSEAELLDGAGVEQIGSDLLRGTLPRSEEGVAGLRRFDPGEDRVAIELGISLFNLPPGCLNAHQLVTRIVAQGHDLDRRIFP